MRTGQDALLQSIELAVAAEELGVDGAFVRVHHFARQLASPFPLLAAMAARTRTIEIGTAVIDMRYENPLYMAEDAAAADLISGGRLQLGISRGSPEPALDGSASFGYVPAEGETDADLARAHTEVFRLAIAGTGVARGNPQMGAVGGLAIQPQSPGLPDRIWWGAGTRATAVWTAEQGMNLMSSTLLTEDTGVPFDELQAEQIAMFREAWKAAGHEREPRVSVSRSILPLIDDETRHYFGLRAQADSKDQVGHIDGATRALRPQLHRRARQDRGRAGSGCRGARRGHGAGHRAEPTGRGVQRAHARVDREGHRARRWARAPGSSRGLGVRLGERRDVSCALGRSGSAGPRAGHPRACSSCSP